LVQGGQDFYFLFLYILMKEKKTKVKQKLIKNIKKYITKKIHLLFKI
jgi:hypothetical protein